MARRKIACIYSISFRSKDGNNVYIGSTVDFFKRQNAHLNELRKNKHSNEYLQFCFDKYQEEKVDFDILFEFNEQNLERRYQIEEGFIQALKPNLNKDLYPNEKSLNLKFLLWGLKIFSPKDIQFMQNLYYDYHLATRDVRTILFKIYGIKIRNPSVVKRYNRYRK